MNSTVYAVRVVSRWVDVSVSCSLLLLAQLRDVGAPCKTAAGSLDIRSHLSARRALSTGCRVRRGRCLYSQAVLFDHGALGLLPAGGKQGCGTLERLQPSSQWGLHPGKRVFSYRFRTPRHINVSYSRVVLGAVSKGRSSNRQVNFQFGRLGGLLLAADLSLDLVLVPS